MNFFKFFSQVLWRPGIGDNNWWGWSAVVLYYGTALLAALLAWRACRKPVAPQEKRDTRFFVLLALLFFGLGVIRQFGLLRWFTQLGRTIAWQHEWYMARTLPQQQLIQVIFYGTALLIILLLWLNRQRLLRRGPLVLGVATLLGYLGIRTVSLHSLDYLFAYRRVEGIPLGVAFELGSLLFISAALVLPPLFRHCQWPLRTLFTKFSERYG